LEDLIELCREFREALNRREVALVSAAVVVGENVGEGALVEADREVRVDALAAISSIVISYRPGGRPSIVFTVEVTSACSFLAIAEETKIPRWPTLSCTM
jgi:hypothetical protein